MSARKKKEAAAAQEWRPEEEWRPCFTFMLDWYDCIKDLPEESQGRLYRALVEFGLKFIEPKFDEPTEKFYWKVLRNQALYGWKKYVAGKGAKKKKEKEKMVGYFRDDSNEEAKEPDKIGLSD